MAGEGDRAFFEQFFDREAAPETMAHALGCKGVAVGAQEVLAKHPAHEVALVVAEPEEAGEELELPSRRHGLGMEPSTHDRWRHGGKVGEELHELILRKAVFERNGREVLGEGFSEQL